ncbi:MAG: hypothetical protein HRT38_17555 [Alteromonadaceae bacterium]|nr:hypothetical protein [Alteromonadaceae bacterium]
MRREFDNIYKSIMDSYKYDQESSLSQGKVYIKTKNIVSSIVHRNINKLNEQRLNVRNDAIHFLIINLHQLVALPLALNNSFKDDVIQWLQSDAESILKEAIQIAKNKEEHNNVDFNRNDEGLTLTGGDVLKAVASIYDDLKLSKVNLWGG